MSEKSKETGIGNFPIVKKIMHLLKMDDDGQINKFFEREVRLIEKDIKTLETNKAIRLMEKESALQTVREKLEDAKQDFEEGKLAVTIEKIKNNASIDNFRKEYWKNVLQKKDNIKYYEKTLVITEENFNKDIEAIDADIAERKERIAMITE